VFSFTGENRITEDNMTAELVPKPDIQPPEYVTADKFDAFRLEMRTELSSLRQQLITHETRLTAAQDKQTGDIAVITAMMEHEQQERKKDIANLRTDFATMLEQLKAISTGMTTLATSIAGLQGSMTNWQAVMEAQNREHDKLNQQMAEHARKFTDLERDVDLVMSTGAANTAAIDSVKGALYGDPNKPDAPDSLYKMVANLSGQLTSSTQEHSKLILSLMSQGQGVTTRLDTIERQQIEQAEKWKRRREQLQSMIVGAATSKTSKAGGLIGLLLTSGLLLPQAAESVHLLIEIVLEMFK
jgi:chromosome segregation ATPase